MNDRDIEINLRLPKNTVHRLALAAHEADVTLNSYIQTVLYRGKEDYHGQPETAEAEVGIEERGESISHLPQSRVS